MNYHHDIYDKNSKMTNPKLTTENLDCSLFTFSVPVKLIITPEQRQQLVSSLLQITNCSFR